MTAFYDLLTAILAGVGTIALVALMGAVVYFAWKLTLDVTRND